MNHRLPSCQQRAKMSQFFLCTRQSSLFVQSEMHVNYFHRNIYAANCLKTHQLLLYPELLYKDKYDYQVINDDLKKTIKSIKKIIKRAK